MEMNEAISLYCAKSEQEKMMILARLSHQITIFARDTYELENEGLSEPEKLRCINEIMHRILGQLNKHLYSDSDRYSDDVFVKMIFDMADRSHMWKSLSSGFADCFNFISSK